MYETYYGLEKSPFGLAPDPEFMFWSDGHVSALTALEYGIASKAATIAITGEVGCGKTIIAQYLMQRIRHQKVVAYLGQTTRSEASLLPWIARAFGLKVNSGDDAELSAALSDFLAKQYSMGNPALLIIDEAQNLSVAALEQLRLLSNINVGKDIFLQTVLLGQPELARRLKRRDMRQFLQRISLHFRLDPFKRADTAEYIRHRLRIAGVKGELFDDYAFGGVHLFTGGVPRLINTLCDHALVRGFAMDRTRIDLKTVVEVKDALGEFDLDLFQTATA